MYKIAPLLLIFLLAGCAGRQFDRPESGSIVPGKSTRAEIVKEYGKTGKAGQSLTNGVAIDYANYTFAVSQILNTSAVTPVRLLAVYYQKDVVVGYLFLSSFDQDTTNFDVTRAPQIIKNSTKKADVIALLGPPGGEYIFPMAKLPDGRALVYSYSEVSGGLLKSHIRKSLVVNYGPDDVVTDVEMNSYSD